MYLIMCIRLCVFNYVYSIVCFHCCVFDAGGQLEIFESVVQSTKRGTPKLLKEDNVLKYCFADSSVEEILWIVY